MITRQIRLRKRRNLVTPRGLRVAGLFFGSYQVEPHRSVSDFDGTGIEVIDPWLQ
jgi:hypothetical protein